MNKEKIIIELSRISTPTGITLYGDITLDDYTCDEILDYITEQEKENNNLKQALNKIKKCCEENAIEVNTREYGNLVVTNTDDISEIINKVLGEKNE